MIYKYQVRSLEHFARALSGHEWRIIISDRATYPLTVVLESKTIVASPNVELFDLALATQCYDVARKRASLRSEKPSVRARRLTQFAHRSIVPSAQQWLIRQFPRLAQLGGLYLPGKDLWGFCITEKQARFKSLGRGCFRDFQNGIEVVSNLGLTGIESDMKRLTAAIRKGNVSFSRLRGLEEFPVATIPFKLSTVLPEDMESSEHIMNDSEVISTMESVYKCTMSKAESLEARLPTGKLKSTGIHLDHSQLVVAAIASRLNQTANIFRRPSTAIEPSFDPTKFLLIIHLDLNDLKDHYEWSGNQWPIMKRTILGFVRAYVKLDCDLIVEGYADQVIKLPSNENAIVQFRTTIKGIDDPVDNIFWHDVRSYISAPPKFPGKPTHFHPLTARHIASTYRRLMETHGHVFRSTFWLARSACYKEFPRHRNLGLYERMADYIDNEFESLMRDLPAGTFDSQPALLPQDEIVALGKPGGFLSKTFFGTNPQ